MFLFLLCGFVLWSPSEGVVRSVAATRKKYDLHIGGLFPMSGDWAGGQACRPAVKMAFDHVNRNPHLLPDYNLVLRDQDSECNAGLGTRKMYDLLYNKTAQGKIITLLTGCSTVSTFVAQTAKMWNLIVLSYGSSSPALSDRERFPTFFRTHPSAALNNPTRLRIIKRYNWTKVFILSSNEEVFASTSSNLEELLKQHKITVMSEIVFDASQAVKQLKNKEARIIVGLFYDPMAREVFCEAYKQGLYGSKYQWILIGWYSDNWYTQVRNPNENVNCTVAEMRKAVDYHLTTESLTWNSPDDITDIGITARQFKEKLLNDIGKSEVGSIPGFPEAPFAYDAVWALAFALNKTEERLRPKKLTLLDFEYHEPNHTVFFELNNALSETSFRGVSSDVYFDKKGNRIAWTQIEQMIDGVYYKIGSYQVKEDNLTIQREPRWADGVKPRSQPLIQPLFTPVNAVLYSAMTILASLGMIACGLCALFLFKFRCHSSVLTSQPSLHAALLVGCSISLAAIVMFGVDRFEGGMTKVSSNGFHYLCHLKAWLLALGFSTGYGSLFAKTWMVYRLATGRKSGSQPRDWEPHVLLAVLVILDIVILTTWQVHDPLILRKETFPVIKSDDDTEYHPFSRFCYSNNTTLWLGITFTWKGLLLLFGLLLAYETRNVKIKQVSDSRFAGMAVYNVVVLCVITGPVTLIIGYQVTATFAFVSTAVFLCCLLSLCLLFGPKINAVFKSGGESKAESDSLNTVSKEDEEKYNQLLVENERLRADIGDCEVRLRKLHTELSDKLETQDSTSNALVSSRKDKLEVEATSGFYSCSDMLGSTSRVNTQTTAVNNSSVLSSETYL